MIRRTALQVLGEHAQVILFGSRADDAALGGDVDLLVTVPHAVDEPAVLSARMASRISRAMDGRKVDLGLASAQFAASSHCPGSQTNGSAAVKLDA